MTALAFKPFFGEIGRKRKPRLSAINNEYCSLGDPIPAPDYKPSILKKWPKKTNFHSDNLEVRD